MIDYNVSRINLLTTQNCIWQTCTLWVVIFCASRVIVCRTRRGQKSRRVLHHDCSVGSHTRNHVHPGLVSVMVQWHANAETTSGVGKSCSNIMHVLMYNAVDFLLTQCTTIVNICFATCSHNITVRQHITDCM